MDWAKNEVIMPSKKERKKNHFLCEKNPPTGSILGSLALFT